MNNSSVWFFCRYDRKSLRVWKAGKNCRLLHLEGGDSHVVGDYDVVDSLGTFHRRSADSFSASRLTPILQARSAEIQNKILAYFLVMNNSKFRSNFVGEIEWRQRMPTFALYAKRLVKLIPCRGPYQSSHFCPRQLWEVFFWLKARE